MMNRSLPLLLLLCAAGTHAQQMYKWVGPDGKTNYTDTPPPASVQQVEKKTSVSTGTIEGALPYELSQAIKGNPVIFYSGSDCAPCDEGRKLLNNRGIPFTEKSVKSNEDIEQLRQTSGDRQLPFLLIGRNKLQGFESGAWNSALSAASYPESGKLPANYRNPPVQSAAPAPKVVATTQEKPATSDNAPTQPLNIAPSPAGNAPQGFRF